MSPAAQYIVVEYWGGPRKTWLVIHVATRHVLCECYDQISAAGIASVGAAADRNAKALA